MVKWAKRELDLAGYQEDQEEGPNTWLREGTIELLDTFAKQGHSGMSAPFAVQMFSRLASWKPLTPLTGEEDEWEQNQNTRFSEVFRDDDGQAYWISGIVFWEWVTDEHINDGKPFKSYFTSKGSRVNIEFPWMPPDEPEYREWKE